MLWKAFGFYSLICFGPFKKCLRVVNPSLAWNLKQSGHMFLSVSVTQVWAQQHTPFSHRFAKEELVSRRRQVHRNTQHVLTAAVSEPQNHPGGESFLLFFKSYLLYFAWISFLSNWWKEHPARSLQRRHVLLKKPATCV